MKTYSDMLKVFLLISFASIFSACASLNSERIAPSLTNAFDSIKGALIGYPEPMITREQVNNIPYASALMKIGKGANGLVILESISNKSYTWVSSDNVYIVIKEGRIEKTEGLFNNIASLKSPNQSFKDFLEDPNPIKDYFVYYSYNKPLLIDLKVKVSLLNKGLQEINILGEVKKLILIEENIFSEEIRWSKTNFYWIDPQDYFVWKSIQHISPKLPPFEFQVTKRPGI